MTTCRYDGLTSAESHYTTHSLKTCTGKEKPGVAVHPSPHTVPPTHYRSTFGSQTGDTSTYVRWIHEFMETGSLRSLCDSAMNLFYEHIHVILMTSSLMIGCGSGLLYGLMGTRNSQTARGSESRTSRWPTCTICGDGITSQTIPPKYWLRNCYKCKQLRCCDCSDRVLECGNPCHKYSKQHRREPDSRSLFYPPTLQDFIDDHPECRWCLR